MIMDIKKDEPLWVEKYRPQKIADAILPKAIKSTLQGYAKEGLVPNSIFNGGPGVGKTTAAHALFTEMKADYYFINGSLNGGIDTLRTDIADFASSVSFTGRRKYVVLDEADYLNPSSTQPALRGVIEEFSKNCGFVLTSNFATRLIPPIHSRCPVLEFAIPIKEREALANQFMLRVRHILKLEGVTASDEVLAEIILKFFPDWRKILNVLQNSVIDKTIDIEALTSVSDEEIRRLYGLLKGANFPKVREWAAQFGTDHPKDLFRSLYAMAADYLTPSGQAEFIITINTYEYQAAFVANQEINLMAALVKIMTEVEFK